MLVAAVDKTAAGLVVEDSRLAVVGKHPAEDNRLVAGSSEPVEVRAVAVAPRTARCGSL